jgi:hypothetical protein
LVSVADSHEDKGANVHIRQGWSAEDYLACSGLGRNLMRLGWEHCCGWSQRHSRAPFPAERDCAESQSQQHEHLETLKNSSDALGGTISEFFGGLFGIRRNLMRPG